MTPLTLSAAIAALLEGVSRKDLEQRAGKLSAVYRDGGTSAGIADPGRRAGLSGDAVSGDLCRDPRGFRAG